MKKRLLAMFLTVVMFINLLPVIAFADGHANVADGVNQNILTDSFGDSRYTNGMLYQWNMKDRYTPVTRTLTDDGFYTVTNGNMGQTENNYAVTYLTARDMVDGTDYSASWTDYSVEMTGRLNTGATTNQNKMLLMGRVQKHDDGSFTYYAASLRYETNAVYLYKATIGADLKQKLTLVASGLPTISLDTFYTLKLSFDGSTIKVAVDGVDYITYEDSEYACGTVGFAMTRDGSMTIDSIKVIHDDDASVFVEDFADSRYFDGMINKWNPDGADIWENAGGVYGALIEDKTPVAVTARWNEKEGKWPYGSEAVQEGAFVITNATTAASNVNYVNNYLTLLDSDDVNRATLWTDYSVEMKGKLTSYIDQSKLEVMGRAKVDQNGVYSYYAAGIMYRSSGDPAVGSISPYVYLYKYSQAVEVGDVAATLIKTSETMLPDTATVSDDYTIKMTLSANTVIVSVNGQEYIRHEDTPSDTNTPLTSGGVGMRIVRNGVAQIEYIKVTDQANNTLFEDQFTDGAKLEGETGYMLGNAYNVGAIPEPPSEVFDANAKWVYYDNGSMFRNYADGYLNFGVANGGSYTKSTAVNRLVLGNAEKNFTEEWTDYSIEARIKFLSWAANKDDFQTVLNPQITYSDGSAPKFGLLGRIQANDDGTFTAFELDYRKDTNKIFFANVSFDSSKHRSDTSTTETVSQTAASIDPTTGYFTLKLTFTGSTATAYVNDTLMGTFPGVENAAGSIGFDFLRGGCVSVDYIKVTDSNNKVLFVDEFTDDGYVTGKPGYFYKKAFSLEEPQVEPVPQLPVQKTDSVSLISATSGTVDFAQSWKDYAMDVDFLLENDKSAAGIVARATADGYYELRVTKDKVALVKVTESGEEELTSVAAETALNTWHIAKMAVEGTVVKAYLNGTELFTCDTAANATAFTVGTVGLKAAGSVKFDNFTAYPVEAEEMRKYRTFKFTASNVNGLADWNLNEEDWDIGGRLLTSKVDDGIAVAVLSNKRAVNNYAAESKVTMPVAGVAGLIGRSSIDGTDYYMFRVNALTGAELVKVVDGNETVMKSVAFLDLYEAGVKLQPEAAYVLKLQMYDNMVEGYIDGKLVLRTEDAENPLSFGASGIFGTKGAAFNYLTISKVEVVTGITVVDAEGNPVATQSAPFEVFLGKVPDIKHTYLHVEYYDGTDEDILLDQTSVEAFDGTTTGLKQAKVEYRDATTVFYYNVSTREDAIAQLDQELKALQIPTDLNAEAAVKALFSRYSDLSSMELEAGGISKEAKDNLYAAMEALEFLRYPELKGTDIVFEDRFDTEDSANRYNSDPATLLGQGTPGNWYVENGTMLQYISEDHSYPVRLNTANVVMDSNGRPENWEIRSVSVDVQFVDPTTRAGIYFCFGGSNEEFYYFHITDKNQRISLGKTNTSFKVLNCDSVENPIELQAGVWYNIRVTLDGKGLIKCYVDDRLWIEYQDVPTVQNDNLLTHGSVGLYSSENYVRFDNLVVRGTDLPAADYDDYESSVDLDYVGGTDAYEDDFDDEKTAEGVNANPSHWIELNTEDKWYVKENNGNLVYAVKNNTAGRTHTWLHVFETNVDFSTKLKVTEKGYLPVVALSSRVIADESYIRSGYDFSMQRWFITTRMGADFDPVTTYSDVDAAAAAAFLSDGVELAVKVVGKTIELYADGVKVHTKDADLKTMPGRVGIYAEQCNVEVDEVVLKLLSGQGRVNDGVLEYYTNTGSSFHSILEMWDDNGNQILLLYQDGTQSISIDGGQTFIPDNRYGANGFKGNSSLELHDGTYINIKTRGGTGDDKADRVVYYSNDGGKTWPEVARIPINKNHTYAQPAEHINEVRLNETTWRVFYTLTNGTLGCSETFYTDYVEGMENFGEVWYTSKNTPKDFTNSTGWNESYVIQISKDTKDLNGREVKKGTLIQYSSHNSLDSIRYTFSYDGGETWVGDYALPQIPCGTNSCCIKEDPYEPGTYYMTAPYNIPAGLGEAHPRFRVVLLRSYDGLNWEFLGDIDRWGQVTDGNHGYIMQQVNAYLAITEDYVFPTFSRSDQIQADADHSHHMQIGRMYRFEKAKLDAYDVWPQEYIIPDKTITSIEVIPGKANVTLNDTDPLAGSKIKVYYYNADPELVDLADVMDLTKDLNEPRAFATLPDTSTAGEKTVVVDYKHFRTVYTIHVVKGDNPAISGVEDGKTYCGAQEVTVTDANGDLASVTLNGNAVSLTDGKFTVSAAEGQQTIVATDKAGNATTITVTVNADHTWSATWTTENEQHWKECTVDGCEATTTKTACSGGTADCQNKAVCETCKQEYGEKSANHKWATEWTSDGTNHWHKCKTAGCNEIKDEAGHTPAQDDGDCTTAIKCTVCQKVTTEAKANHTPAQDDGDCTTEIRCTVCQKVTTAAKESHTGGTATCEAKAECTVCGKEYGELAAHKGGEATCTDKAKCEVCGEAYGELNADKHTKEAKWTITADKHSKAYECCGKVVVAEEAHEWKDGKCEECGYEAEVGTEQKPIEIPADKETVKEEAKVEAGAEQHYELDEKLAGKVITVKGEDAFVIVDGKKYEAKNGIVEVKLPTKTGKISVVIGNAGTKAGAFSITIATPSEDNSDTGDNAAIVLFGSLMALSVLTAGVLLIPGIRKRLIK